MPGTNKAAQGAGSIRQRPDGRWEARVTTGTDPATGKPIRRSIYGKTQREVRTKMTEIISALDMGTYTEPCKMTLAEWLETWSADYIANVKPSTAFLYKEQIRLYIGPALGNIRLESLSPHTIQHFYNSLTQERDGKRPLSAKSVKNIHGILHRALQQAVRIGYLRSNPSEACTLPRVEKADIRPLDESMQAKFLSAIKGHRHETLFKVALFTGMREGELLGLTWNAINFEKGTIAITQQLRKEQKKGGRYYISSPKNNKGRIISPAPFVMQLLKQHRARQAEQRLMLCGLWEDNNLVFPNDTGGFLSYRTVYDCFKRIMAKIGNPKARFHDLRHTYAVMSLNAGDDIKTVQENLGHHTAAFTLDIYGHVTTQMKQASAQRMERYIKGILSA